MQFPNTLYYTSLDQLEAPAASPADCLKVHRPQLLLGGSQWGRQGGTVRETGSHMQRWAPARVRTALRATTFGQPSGRAPHLLIVGGMGYSKIIVGHTTPRSRVGGGVLPRCWFKWTRVHSSMLHGPWLTLAGSEGVGGSTSRCRGWIHFKRGDPLQGVGSKSKEVHEIT